MLTLSEEDRATGWEPAEPTAGAADAGWEAVTPTAGAAAGTGPDEGWEPVEPASGAAAGTGPGVTEGEDWKRQAVPAMEVRGEETAAGAAAGTGPVRAPEVTTPQRTNVVPNGELKSGSRVNEYRGPSSPERAMAGAAQGTIGLPMAGGAGLAMVGDYFGTVAGNFRALANELAERVAPKWYEARRAQAAAKPDELRSSSKNILQEVGTTAYDHYRGMMDEISRVYPQGDVTQNPRLLLDPGWWAQGASQAATSMSGALIAGGGTVMGGAIVGAGMEALPTYQDLTKEGMEGQEAFGRSAVFALAVAALDKAGLDRIFDGDPRLVRKVLLSAVTEGVTEGLEEPSEAIARYAAREGVTLTEFGQQVMQSLREGVNVALTSAVTGGFAGGARIAEQRQAEQDFEQKVGEAGAQAAWNDARVKSRQESRMRDLMGAGVPEDVARKAVYGEDRLDAKAAVKEWLGTVTRKKPVEGAVPVEAKKPVVEKKPAAPGTPTTLIDEPAIEAKSGILPEVATMELPVADLVVQDRIQQFKRGADPKTGVVRGMALTGKYERLGTAPIIAWERNDGIMEVVTGRNRFDLARRTGEQNIPAQVVREADGFTEQMAHRLDVESNIRDGQGEVQDYAHYFRKSPELTREEAEQRGLVARSKGQAGWALGRDAADDLYAKYQAGRIAEDKAIAIAQAAPGNPAIQAAGMAYAMEPGVTALDVGNYVQQLAVKAKEGGGPVETPGDWLLDTTWLDQTKAIAKLASRKQYAIEQQLSVLRAGRRLGKGKFSEIAKKYGINVNDPGAINQAMDALFAEMEAWKRWATDSGRMKALRVELGFDKAEENAAAQVAAVTEPVESGNPKGKLDNVQAYRDAGQAARSELDGLLGGGEVKEAPAVYGGDLAEGAQGESTLRRALRLTAESRGQAQATDRVDALATRALQSKARALLDGLDAGRIDEEEAGRRWAQAQGQIAKGQKKLENRPAPKATTGDMFAPSGPAPGMLLEERAGYGGEDIKAGFDTGNQPARLTPEDAKARLDNYRAITLKSENDSDLELAKWGIVEKIYRMAQWAEKVYPGTPLKDIFMIVVTKGRYAEKEVLDAVLVKRDDHQKAIEYLSKLYKPGSGEMNVQPGMATYNTRDKGYPKYAEWKKGAKFNLEEARAGQAAKLANKEAKKQAELEETDLFARAEKIAKASQLTLFESRAQYGAQDQKIIDAGARAVLGATDGRAPTLDEAKAALGQYGEKIAPYLERIHKEAVSRAEPASGMAWTRAIAGGFEVEKKAGKYVLSTPAGRKIDLDLENPEDKMLVDRLEAGEDDGVRERGGAYEVNEAQIESFLDKQEVPQDQRPAARKELAVWAAISGSGMQADLPGFGSEAGQEGVLPAGNRGTRPAPRYRYGVSRTEAEIARQGQAQAAAREAWLNPTPENWARAFELNGKTVSTVLPALMAQKIPAVDVRGMVVEEPADAAGVLWMMKTPLIESFKVLYLDSNGAILEARVVSTGILDASLVHPREVFRNAPEGTAGVVLGHNHPSSNLVPSKEDIRITRQVKEAGDILGIPVMDHVLTNGKFVSLQQAGLVEFSARMSNVKGSIPEKDRRQAPRMGSEYKSEPWELIRRENQTKVNHPQLAADWFKMLRQEKQGDYRHVLIVGTHNGIVSAIRVPFQATAREISRSVMEQAGQAGGYGFILEITDSAEDIRLVRQLEQAGRVIGLKLIDAVQWTTNPDAPYISMLEQGVITNDGYGGGLTSEEQAEYWVAEDKAEYGDLVSLAQKIAGRGPDADVAMFESWYSGMAPLGDPKAAVNDPNWSVFPAEIPEAVQFAKELLGGKYPKTAAVLRAMKGQAAGYARVMPGRTTGMEIALRRDLFRLIPSDVMETLQTLADQYAAQNPPTNPQDTPAIIRARYLQFLTDQTVQTLMTERPAAASHVLWHEIGHLADHIPDGMLHQRGNILGRIASLKGFTRDMLPLEHKDLSKLMTREERYEIRKKAAKDVGPAPNKKDEAAVTEWREAVKARYQEMLDEEAKKRGLARKQWIIDELEALSMWWRSDQEMSDYTSKPEELYANAFSAILNNPEAVHQRAPTYYQAFFRWLEDKPTVKRLYDEIQDRIVTGAVQDQRAADQLQSMIEADRKSQEFSDALNKMTFTDWRDVFTMSMDRRFSPIYRRRNSTEMDTKMRSQKAIADWLYHQASNKLYLERMVNEVGLPLREAKVSRAEFNLYLANLHILHNRFDIANPQGMDAPAAQQALDAQKARLGPDKWAAMESVDAARWKIRNEEVLDLAPLRVMLSDEMIGILKARRYYSTVSAVDTSKDAIQSLFDGRYGGQVGGMIYHQVGYLGDAKSPMLATSQKDVSLISAAYRNEAVASSVAVLKELGEGKASAWTFDKNTNRQVPVIVENGKFKTLVWLEKGEIQAWDAPAAVHDMIQRSTPQDAKAGMMILGAATRALKSAWTDLNYGFWPMNYIRDTKGFVLNMPGVYSRVFGKNAYIQYRGRAMEAARSILEGKPNELAKQAMRRNMIIVTREYVAGENGLDSFERFMKGFGIDPAWFGYSDTPAGRRGFWRRYMDVGRRLEYEVKIAGMLHVDAEARLKGLPEAEKQRIVQEYAGSPNFLDRGTANWLMDAVLPFYNPAKQGYRRSIAAWRENPWEKALKMLKYAVLPKLVKLALLGSAGALLLGKKKQEELKAADESIPTWDKANYDSIPLGFADRRRGKALYWRGVEEEEERLIGGIIAMGIAKAQGQDVRLADVVNFAGGQLPGLNPIGLVLYKGGQFLGGINPQDRGGKIVDQTRYDAGLGGVEMAKWTANQLGAGLLVRFQRDNFYDPDPTVIEKVLNLPVISNVAGRFLKVSNRGLDQKAERDFRAPARERSAKMRLGIQEIMQDGMNENNQAALMEPGAKEYLKAAAKEKAIQEAGVDPYTREIMRVMNSPMKRAVLQSSK